jgi:predicted TIM-barrel fold metal-dependent hydrolase
MRLFDCHSHFSTYAGANSVDPVDLENSYRVFKRRREFQTDEQMGEYLRRNSVKTILNPARARFFETIEEASSHFDYAIGFQKQFSDVVFGLWLSFRPRWGKDALREFERVRSSIDGFVGFSVAGTQVPGCPASDPIWDPFYKVCIDLDIPVLIHTGLTGIGQGFRGGKGIVAARFPELRILAGRPAYPWQNDMIAVLLHKANVMYEVHGWSPKHFSPELKKEIGRRLQDRVMFGCDYPGLLYERLLDDWRSLELSEEVLQKVFWSNAAAYFSVTA